jgi:hypothetical protein
MPLRPHQQRQPLRNLRLPLSLQMRLNHPPHQQRRMRYLEITLC